MPASKKWISNPHNISQVLAEYRSSPITIKDLAKKLNTSYHNVRETLAMHMPEQEYKARQAVRYSLTKVGDLNPMKGKTGSQHHNYIGDCSDCKGYLTRLHNGKRIFTHHAVMLEALGLDALPEGFCVHHVDGDPLNNSLDNLALCTHAGHKTIHSLQKLTKAEKSRLSTLAAIHQSGTSP